MNFDTLSKGGPRSAAEGACRTGLPGCAFWIPHMVATPSQVHIRIVVVPEKPCDTTRTGGFH